MHKTRNVVTTSRSESFAFSVSGISSVAGIIHYLSPGIEKTVKQNTEAANFLNLDYRTTRADDHMLSFLAPIKGADNAYATKDFHHPLSNSVKYNFPFNNMSFKPYIDMDYMEMKIG